MDNIELTPVADGDDVLEMQRQVDDVRLWTREWSII